ncbi:retrotransposon protein, putative, ty1-copia subclass [Tanacetum coccineum]
MHVIEQPLPPAPEAGAEPNIMAQWTTLYDAHTEIACFRSIDQCLRNKLELEKIDLNNLSLLQTRKRRVNQVADYILKMKGYTIGEIHAMLIEYEKGLPKMAGNTQENDKKVISLTNNPKPTAKDRPSKDDACTTCKDVFKNEVENQLGKTIKAIRSDRGGEYISQEFKDYLKANGIVQQLTPPYTPQHNGVSEYEEKPHIIRYGEIYDESYSSTFILCDYALSLQHAFSIWSNKEIQSMIAQYGMGPRSDLPPGLDWKSSKQSTTAMSATESEYIAASEAAMEAVWIRKFISGLGEWADQEKRELRSETIAGMLPDLNDDRNCIWTPENGWLGFWALHFAQAGKSLVIGNILEERRIPNEKHNASVQVCVGKSHANKEILGNHRDTLGISWDKEMGRGVEGRVTGSRSWGVDPRGLPRIAHGKLLLKIHPKKAMLE